MGQRSIPCPQGAAWAILITRGNSSGLLNFGTIYILGWIILCCGDCSLYHKILSSIPGFTNEMLVTSPECDDRKWLQTLAKSAHLQRGGAKITPFESHWVRQGQREKLKSETCPALWYSSYCLIQPLGSIFISFQSQEMSWPDF